MCWCGKPGEFFCRECGEMYCIGHSCWCFACRCPCHGGEQDRRTCVPVED